MAPPPKNHIIPRFLSRRVLFSLGVITVILAVVSLELVKLGGLKRILLLMKMDESFLMFNFFL